MQYSKLVITLLGIVCLAPIAIYLPVLYVLPLVLIRLIVHDVVVWHYRPSILNVSLHHPLLLVLVVLILLVLLLPPSPSYSLSISVLDSTRRIFIFLLCWLVLWLNVLWLNVDSTEIDVIDLVVDLVVAVCISFWHVLRLLSPCSIISWVTVSFLELVLHYPILLPPVNLVIISVFLIVVT